MRLSDNAPSNGVQPNPPRSRPIYLDFLNKEKLKLRINAASAAIHECHLCGNDCGIDRTQRAGPCRIGETVYVASYGPHHGEENVLSGWCGSGTVFFSGCNLHCVYCQNDDISQTTSGFAVTPGDLAHIMLTLQKNGCHNINLVSPTHVAAHIIPALAIAVQAGLNIPVVYNTGGYDAAQALALMDGFIDIYMPDMKYGDADIGQQLSGVKDYPGVNQAAVKEMHRQVGDLVTGEDNLARRGLLVRHLVLPGGLAGTTEITRFLAEEISPHTYINVMAQYHPSYQAGRILAVGTPINRHITAQEYQKALALARAAGLHRFSD